MNSESGMPYRSLGRTGEKVSLIGLGGYHLGFPQLDEQEAIRIIRTAIDSGINFLDNCWDYNNGESEIRMGKALRDGYRQKAFLMTKFDARSKAGAMRQIEESLCRLQVDSVDLLQLHEVSFPEDPERVFARGGAIEALLEAKQAGKTRYIGFTGHKDYEMHLGLLRAALSRGIVFDAVQLPLNLMDPHYRSFEKNVLPLLLEHNIAPLAMKPMGDLIFLRSGLVDPIECLHYAMNLPVSVVITGCDSMPILKQALEAARTYRPLSEAEVSAMLSKTAKVANLGQFELYKTSHFFDGTYYDPEWLD
jgi:aryl-alcohol dehydrogenase-like predicted oxidoreductase